MLSNCEKMVVISSTTNEWPQNHIDEKELMMASMEKPSQEQPQALKCPRCDSSNTKFCYYNNYSLSQPRHFCKACKRYWTRGGTLRNVPVGGGCRKNKRVKRPTATSTSSSSAVDGVSPTNPNPPSQPQINVSSTSINHLFYGLANTNLPLATRFNGGYDLNGLGIGYSSSDIGNGFSVNPNTLLSSYSTIFGSSSCTTATATTTPPTIASLLASTLHQHKFMNVGGGGVKNSQPSPNHFQNLAAFQDVEVTGHAENGLTMKDIKLEEGQNRMEWNVACQNQFDQIGFSDPTVYWNPTSVGGGTWHDPANIGSSVTSLI